MIPAAAIVVTRDEERALPRCLAGLGDFAAVIVVDSASTDRTAAAARAAGAQFVPYAWDGRYPKKRQWCLENIALAHDWVFFIDADEEMTPALAQEMARLFAAGPPPRAGYFVRGRYVSGGRALRRGLHNSKLVLFDRRAFAYPVVDDLGLPMGEIEGHYQPVARRADARTGRLQAPLLHHADEDRARWLSRHERYAAWEAGMNRRAAWPGDPVPARQMMKLLFRALPCRAAAAFVHALLLKGGICEGPAGWRQARDRYLYYRMVARAMKAPPAQDGL